MADDLRVAIRLSVDGKQAVGELKIARAELAGLSTEAKRSGLSAGLKDSDGHARNLASGIKSIGPAIGVAFAVGAITNFAREVGQAAIQLQKTQATLTFAAGSAVEAAKGYEFASNEARRLGLDVASTAQSYAKFSAAAKGTAISAEEVKRVFTGVQEASRALGLSTGETENAIRALVQMLSKGKITADEFRGQLGDALPGATRIAAKALGVTTEEFSRMLDEGELTLDLITKLGDAFHKEFGVTATQAAKGLAAETNRLSNAWTEFLQNVGDSGAISVATTAMKGLGAALQAVNELLKTHNELFPTDIAPEEFLDGRREFLLRGTSRQDLDRQRGRGNVANLVPGASSAVPRQGGETPAILRETELNYAKKGLEQVQAREKAEAEAYKASLARTRALATAQENVARERALQEKEIARLQQEAFDDNLDSIAEEQQAWKDSLDVISDSIKERQKLEQDAADERTRFLESQAAEQSRIMLAPFENALEGIQDGFTGAFESIFSGGVDTFSDLASTIKSVFIRLAAEIAALLVFRPVVAGILGAVGASGLSAALGLGGGAGGGGGAAGDFFNLLGAGSQVSSAFGGPSIGSSINSFGNSIGFGGFGGQSLSSILGSAGIGAGIGGLLSGALGGNRTIGSIAGGLGAIGGGFAGSAIVGASGAALGATAGSVVPVIGTIIGAILGGLLGSAFKQTPPRGFTTHEVGVGTLREGGKKGFDPDSFDPLTRSIDKAITGLGKELGINTKGIQYWIGFKEGEGYQTTVKGGGDGNFQDTKKLTRTILLQELEARATTPFQKRILGRAAGSGSLEGALGRIASDLDFKKQWEDILGGPDRKAMMRDLSEELKNVNEEFGKMTARAKDLGLSIQGSRDALRDRQLELIAGKAGLSFDEFRKQWEVMLGGSDRKAMMRDLSEELENVNEEFLKMQVLAKELGLSLKGSGMALMNARREFLAGQAGGAVGQIQRNLDALGITDLRAFRNELKLSPDVAPLQRLAEAKRLFNQTSRQARGGDLTAVHDLPGIAQRALAIQEEVFANGPQTAQFRERIQRVLDGLITKLTPSKVNFDDLSATMREVGTVQINQLKRETNRTIEMLELILRELRKKAA